MIREATQKVDAGRDLTRAEARAVMEELLSGGVPDPEIIAFLSALRDKGEKPAELVGFAEVMRRRAAELLTEAGAPLNGLAAGGPLLDTCGTGGHGHRTFNVSTAVALVAAEAGRARKSPPSTKVKSAAASSRARAGRRIIRGWPARGGWGSAIS